MFCRFLFQPAGPDSETMLNTLGALLLTLLAILYGTFGGIAWINWQEAQSLIDEITLDNLDDETKNRSRKNFE